MKKDLYYSAAEDRWTCVSERPMDAAEALRAKLAVMKHQSESLMQETDPGRAEILRQSIVALTEGRITQTMGVSAPALIGR